jgi:hypothetical protein
MSDLIPYVILLGLKTGISPEGIASLKIDSVVSIGDRRIRVEWYKARGGGREADTFSARGDWSPGRLFQRVANITADARRFAAPDIKSRLWIRYSATKREDVYIRTLTADISSSVRRFVTDHDLLDEDGQPLRIDIRALRKTFLARLNKRFQGAVSLTAGVNQSAQVAADHYLAIGEETPAIRQAIEDTQWSLVQRAKRVYQATVLSEVELDSLKGDSGSAAARFGIEADRAKSLLTSETDDVFIAKCKDFKHSPFGKPGEPCPAAVWECLFCPLAIITPSKLPAILALLDHIQARFEEMLSADWQARYGDTYTAITQQIIPQFSDTVVAAARAAVGSAPLYFRPEESIT